MIYALHGMMGHPKDWDHLGLKVQAVDLWKAFLDSKSPSLECWAQSFNEEVESGGEKILMGYSMGGRQALHALLNQPNTWSGVIVISTHPGLQNNEERESRLMNDQQWASRARELPWTDFLKLWNEQMTLKSGAGSLFQADLNNCREQVACALECWSLGQQKDLRPALEQCRTPVLWITGGRDEKFTRLAGEVASSNESFEHAVIADAGHRLLFENGKPLNSLKSVIGDFQKQIL